MKRHDTDGLSLVAGTLFTALAVVFLLHAFGTFDINAGLVPAVTLLAVGVGIMVSMLTSGRGAEREPQGESLPSREPEPVGPAAPEPPADPEPFVGSGTEI